MKYSEFHFATVYFKSKNSTKLEVKIPRFFLVSQLSLLLYTSGLLLPSALLAVAAVGCSDLGSVPGVTDDFPFPPVVVYNRDI